MEKKQDSIGAIWEKVGKNGQVFLSITLNGKRYIAFRNKYKKENKHPDFRILESNPDYEKPQSVEVPFEDEIPF